MEELFSHPFLQAVDQKQNTLIKAGAHTKDFIATRPCQVLRSSTGKPLVVLFFGPDAGNTNEQGLLMSMRAGEARLTCDMVAMLSKDGASFGFHVTFLRPGKACVDFLQKRTNLDRSGEQLNEINIISQFDTMTFDYDIRTGRKMRLTTVANTSTGAAKTLVDHQREGVGLKRENLRLEMRFTPESHSSFASELSQGCFWCQDRLISVDIPVPADRDAGRLRWRGRTRSRSRRSRRRDSPPNRRLSRSWSVSRNTSRSASRGRRRMPYRSCSRSLIRRRMPDRSRRRVPDRSRSRSVSRRRVPDRSRRRVPDRNRDRQPERERSPRESVSVSRSASRTRIRVASCSRSISRPRAAGRPSNSGAGNSNYDFIVQNLKVGKLMEGELAQRLSSKEVVMDLNYRCAKTWTIDLGVADFQLAPEPSTSDLLKSCQASAEAEAKRVAKDIRQFNADECVICLSDPPCVTLVPCGHRCVCKGCCGLDIATPSPRLSQCAICRGHVDAYLLH